MECNLCGAKAWQGNNCSKCPLQGKCHYVEGTGAKKWTADCFCIAESPEVSAISRDVEKHSPWALSVEQSVRSIFDQYMSFNAQFAVLSCRYTYAIRCQKDKPNKKEIVACNALLYDEINHYARPKKPVLVFALGMGVLKAFGIKQAGYKKLQGKFIETSAAGRRIVVFPSVSKRQLLQNVGYLEILKKHVYTFLSAAHDARCNKSISTAVPTDMLTKGYVFPKTIKQLQKLTEEIINYAPKGRDPHRVPLSIDTETNTLYPHRSKLKLLTFVVSWAPKKAASIPVEHPDSPFTLEEVAPFIQAICSCAKPKILHNFKYDLRVLQRKGWDLNNVAWDTMIGEHLLEEDKKGYYSLKELVRSDLPAYRDYEEEVQSIANAKPRRVKEDEVKPEEESEPTNVKGAAKKLKNDQGYEHIPLDILSSYGAIDGDATRQIAPLQLDRMDAEQRELDAKRSDVSRNPYFRSLVRSLSPSKAPLKDLMKYQMIPVIRTLANMESIGIRVDHDYVDTLAQDMDRSLQEIKIKIYKMVPPGIFDEFNPGSTPQLRKLLFSSGYKHPETRETVCYKGIVEPPLTSTGQYSTNAKFLRSLVTQYQCPFAKTILDFRAIQKARTTFIENIRALSLEDGRMHTNFHPHGTSTGRLSSSDENMQNIPKQIGKHNIKKCFIPTCPDTQMLLQADAKAAEVRLYAAYSKDKNLIDALNRGMDPHSFFSAMTLNPATLLQGVPRSERKAVLETIGIDDQHEWSYEDFQRRDYYVGTKENPGSDPEYGRRLDKLRSNIKRVVFGILYGAYKTKIAGIVGISEAQAQAIIDALFNMFPTIVNYTQQTKEQLRFLNMVETFFGRRRRFKNWKAMTYKMRNKAERQVVNFKIQSTSSDIVLRVMADIEEPLYNDFEGKLLITVHDSIVSELPTKYISQMPDFYEEYGVKRVAKLCPWLPVPFKWDLEVGPSYGELIPISKYLRTSTIDASLLQTERDETEYLEQEIRKELATA